MSRSSSYKEGICYNKGCSKPADYSNRKCWLDPDNDKKVFCSPDCGAQYLELIDEIEKENRLIGRIKTRKSRKRKMEREKKEELIEAIYFYSGETFDKRIISKVVKNLALSSPWI